MLSMWVYLKKRKCNVLKIFTKNFIFLVFLFCIIFYYFLLFLYFFVLNARLSKYHMHMDPSLVARVKAIMCKIESLENNTFRFKRELMQGKQELDATKVLFVLTSGYFTVFFVVCADLLERGAQKDSTVCV